MRSTIQLNRRELSQAVADYVAKKIGKTIKGDVTFDVSAATDPMDRPTGGHNITANFSYEVGES